MEGPIVEIMDFLRPAAEVMMVKAGEGGGDRMKRRGWEGV